MNYETCSTFTQLDVLFLQPTRNSNIEKRKHKIVSIKMCLSNCKTS